MTDLERLLAADLSDPANRLVLADCLADADRVAEEWLCRDLPRAVGVLGGAVVRRYTLRHVHDPAAHSWRVWSYVYIDGGAEQLMDLVAEKYHWNRAEGDLVVCDEPRPPPGHHLARIYGVRVVAHIRDERVGGVGGVVRLESEFASERR